MIKAQVVRVCYHKCNRRPGEAVCCPTVYFVGGIILVMKKIKKVIPDADEDQHIPWRGSPPRDEAHPPRDQRGKFPFYGCVSCLTIGAQSAPVGDYIF